MLHDDSAGQRYSLVRLRQGSETVFAKGEIMALFSIGIPEEPYNNVNQLCRYN